MKTLLLLAFVFVLSALGYSSVNDIKSINADVPAYETDSEMPDDLKQFANAWSSEMKEAQNQFIGATMTYFKFGLKFICMIVILIWLEMTFKPFSNFTKK